jgi:hypothetical protein
MGRVFEIYECGDPFSRAWDVCERDGCGGLTYRGDISGRFRGRHLINFLRLSYPGCRVVRRR